MFTRLETLKHFMRTILIHVDRKPVQPPILGRWTLHNCDKKNSIKVDMTNEDHCGVCDKMRYDYIKKNNERND